MTAGLLCLALLLDAILGEPDWLWRRIPHPAVLMGRAVGWCEARLNTGAHRKLKGIAAITLVIIAAAGVASVLSLLGPVVEILVVAVLLAHRSLVSHTRAVADGLRLSLPAGRHAVAMIVSRDTGEMNQSAVARSAIESASENLSDGVVAPAFWFLIGGLPGIVIYKVVNTADSMIGYRTPRYHAFGWAAARLDDLLNLIPARLTALLIALPAGVLGTWRAIAADARLHRSPNAGWPEAAMARAIDVALAGPRAYDGAMQSFPWVHSAGNRDLTARDIDAAIHRMWQAWGLMLGILLILFILSD